MNSLVQRSFAAGELAPALHARADLVKYQTGVKTCRNFFVRKEGGLANRAGFRFVAPCKVHTFGVRLARFVGSIAGEGYLLELGQGYIRFYKDGAAVEVTSVPAYSGGTAYSPGDVVASGGVNYYCQVATTGTAPPNATYWYPLTGAILEVPTPWPLDKLPQWNQSGNVITFTHPEFAPREMIFEEAERWVLRVVSTVSATPAPTGVSGTAGSAGTRTFQYIVTAAAGTTFEESIGSSSAAILAADEPTLDTPHVITWTGVAGAAEYHVYCDPYDNGVYGYIGSSDVTSFRHAGQIADFNLTPPENRVLFASANHYPTCSSNFQQRQFFANSFQEPDAIWGSRTGFRHNYSISSPLQDDDGVTFRLAGNNHHPIRHMIAMAHGLVLMTDGGEWTLTGGGGRKTPITPSSIDAEQDTYVGVLPWARPVVVGNTILYVQARGNVLRELQFTQDIEGMAGRDLTIYASHLFERRQIYYTDFQQTPHSILWCCDNDGRLLGLTYIPEQEVWGWHRHDTDGWFEDVCVVPQADEDVLYVIVHRTVDGETKRYIERLEQRELLPGATHATMFFVDSGLSYAGPEPVFNFAGLEHLEGKRVAVIADGQALYTGVEDEAPVVTGGAIELPPVAGVAGYVHVHVGLPYTPEIETLALDAPGQEGRDAKKRVGTVTLLVHQSSARFEVGHDPRMREHERQAWEPSGLVDDTLEVRISPEYNKHGSVKLRVIEPLPLTILGIIPRGEMGG